MKAVIYAKYGSPEALSLEEVTKPAPGDDEVLIKVHAASINSWDWDLLRGVPFVNRIMAGLLAPKRIKILGCDIAGTVESAGKNVELLQPGDEVFGDLSGCGWGGFAEYVCAPDNALVLKPAGMTFEQAAAVPQAGLLALQGLRDKGGIRPGQKVLVNGAGGGAGSFAIQLAKFFDTDVTGVDSSGKLDLMRSVGADHVIDYTQEDFTRNGQCYDLILDVSGYHSIFDYRRVLNPNGAYVMMGGSTALIFQILLLGPWLSIVGHKRMGLLMHKPNRGLAFISELLEDGSVVPVIDRCYPLSELAEALRYSGEGFARGKVVITVAQN